MCMEACQDLLITLNNRLETAAAAIVHRMINRRRPLVFRPVLPLKKGSIEATAMASRCEVKGKLYSIVIGSSKLSSTLYFAT